MFTYYIIILGGGGGSRAMMILMTQGGWGVQNGPTVDDVIYECSLRLAHFLIVASTRQCSKSLEMSKE